LESAFFGRAHDCRNGERGFAQQSKRGYPPLSEAMTSRLLSNRSNPEAGILGAQRAGKVAGVRRRTRSDDDVKIGASSSGHRWEGPRSPPSTHATCDANKLSRLCARSTDEETKFHLVRRHYLSISIAMHPAGWRFRFVTTKSQIAPNPGKSLECEWGSPPKKRDHHTRSHGGRLGIG
jgi:hypothetical protein